MLVWFRRLVSYRFFPFCWTLLIILLLCIPGSMVPSQGLFGFTHLDKIIHFILFAANVLFWGWHYRQSAIARVRLKKIYAIITFGTAALGIALEFVQLYFIPFRSFDMGDIMADVAGSVLAGIWLLRK